MTVPRRSHGRRFPHREDRAYLNTVRSQACLLRGKTATYVKPMGVYPKKMQRVTVTHVCGWSRSEASHTISKARGGHDWTGLPLCRVAHEEWHHLGDAAFGERWGLQKQITDAKKRQPGPDHPGGPNMIDDGTFPEE